MSTADTTTAHATARATQTIIKGAAARMGGERRTGQPVRRNSRHSGTREVAPWKAHNTFPKVQEARRLRALEHHARQLRVKGRASPLSANVVRIYRLLLRTRCLTTGRLDLAQDKIARMVNLGERTVQRALGLLKEHGWLDWYRRTRPVEDPEPFGQQVEQDTNAYILTLSAAATALVRSLGEGAPKPADQAQREADQAGDVAAMLATVSAQEEAVFRAGAESPMAQALADLGRAVDEHRNASAGSALNPQEI